MCLAPSKTQLLPFPEVLFFRSVDAFPLSCGGESWIDHYLAYGISRLRNDYLQVQVWHAWDHNGLRSSTVRVHRVDTRARTPTLCYVATYSNCVHLRKIAVAIERLLGHQQQAC